MCTTARLAIVATLAVGLAFTGAPTAAGAATGDIAPFAGGDTGVVREAVAAVVAYDAPGAAPDLLFTADQNHTILVRDLVTGTEQRYAGTRGIPGATDGLAENATFNDIIDMAVDGSGNVDLAAGPQIRRIDIASGTVTAYLNASWRAYSDDVAAEAGSGTVKALTIAPDNSACYFLDRSNALRRIDLATSAVTTLAGGTLHGLGAGFADGPVDTAQIDIDDGLDAIAVALDGTLYFVDAGDTGDGGPATAARVNNVGALAVTPDGHVWVGQATSSANTLREIVPGGTVENRSATAWNGDGGAAATEATLTAPVGMLSIGARVGGRAVPAGARGFYIADMGAHRVRRIDTATGIITTVAGTGVQGATGNGGPATNATLDSPTALASDGRALFIATRHRIRRVDFATGRITTVAGTGADGYGGDGQRATRAQLSGVIGGLAFSADFTKLYVADTFNHAIRVINLRTRVIRTVLGTGAPGFTPARRGARPNAARKLSAPTGLVRQGSTLVFGESGNAIIRRFDLKKKRLSTIAGKRGDFTITGDGGAASNASIGFSAGIAVDATGNLLIGATAGNVYAGDTPSNPRIRCIGCAGPGIITTVAGSGTTGNSGDGGPALAASFGIPTGLLAVGNRLYVSDNLNGCVRVIER